jgi:hypothetical protein
VGFFAPPALPVRGIHFPARRVPPATLRRLAPTSEDRSCRRGLHRDGSAVPRRGVPPPLRSAFAVSHDPGGLLLPGPCGVFRPLTPMRFGAPSPRFVPDRVDPKVAVSWRGGRAFGTRRSRLVPCGRRTRPKPRHRPRMEPPLQPLTRPLRRPDPLLCSPRRSSARHPVAQMSVCWPHASRPLRPGCPVRLVPSASPRQQAASTLTVWPHSRGCHPRTVPVNPSRVTAVGDRSRRERTITSRANAFCSDSPALPTGASLDAPVIHVCRLLPPSSDLPRPGGRVGSSSGGCRPRGLV